MYTSTIQPAGCLLVALAQTPPPPHAPVMPFGVFLAVLLFIMGVVALYIFLFRRRGCRVSSFFQLTGRDEACAPMPVRPVHIDRKGKSRYD